uniref:RNA-directed DNA polymerase, eukaryota, reverse transcriptase zinc-binding domain protein n=1 Tax=Tanacetum cinerariifolium TaxID=118510 RepID=A0A6L2N285_TANCI|nr:RNA-directed DNA polymerase, eukaryota, reverse transcriptase zinc-binding domain protein [Tanacetum cinerariifolium]
MERAIYTNTMSGHITITYVDPVSLVRETFAVDTYFVAIVIYVVDTLFVAVVVEVQMVGCGIVVIAFRKQKFGLENESVASDRVGSWSLATRWNTLIPKKVNILFWRVALDRIPTRSNLLMRGINLPDNMYAICGNEIEERDHVFSRSEVAVCTWGAVFRWLQLSTVSMGTINDIIQWVDSCGMPEKKKKVIEAVCLTTISVLWKFINAFIFKSQELRKECIVDSIKELAFLWICNRQKNAFMTG